MAKRRTILNVARRRKVGIVYRGVEQKGHARSSSTEGTWVGKHPGYPAAQYSKKGGGLWIGFSRAPFAKRETRPVTDFRKARFIPHQRAWESRKTIGVKGAFGIKTRASLSSLAIKRRVGKELSGRADAVRKAWATRKRRYGPSGKGKRGVIKKGKR